MPVLRAARGGIDMEQVGRKKSVRRIFQPRECHEKQNGVSFIPD
jgi:hypothetical protein